MVAPAARLTNTGNFLINGTYGFDEATYDLTSGYQKNLFTYSQQFNNPAVWAASGVLQPAPLGVAPDGSNTAVLMSETADQNIAHWFYRNVSPEIPYATYTLSCYFKPVSGDRNFFLQILDAATGGAGGYSSMISNNNGTLNSYAGTVGDFSNGSGTIVPVGNGWFRAIMTQTLGRVSNNTVRIGWLNNGAQYYNGNGVSCMWIWGAQIEAGTQATDYEPTGATAFVAIPQGFTTRLDPTGFYTIGSFDEVAINPNSGVTINLATYSQQFTNPVWNNITRAEIGATNYIAPDGTATASKLIDIPGNTSTGYLRRYYPFQNNVTYTYSVYGKAQEISNLVILNFTDSNAFFGDYVNFNLLTGTVAYNSAPARMLNPTITPVGNGWYRCSAAQTVGGTSYGPYAGPASGGIIAVAPSIDSYSGSSEYGDGVSGILIWGVQVEVGTTATNYISMTSVPSAPYVQRIDNTGLHRVAGQYDEWTGVLATTNGLVTYLDAAVPASTTGSQTQWNDISGTGYGLNATYQNFQSLSTYNPALQAYNFNAPPSGTGGGLQGFQFGTSATSYLRTPYFTMEIWVRHVAFNAGGKYNNYYTNWESYPYTGFRFGAGTPNSLATDTTAAPIFWTNQSGGNFSTAVTGTYPILLNTWCQIAVTYDGYNCNVYVNGTLYSTQANAVYVPGPPYNVNSFNIGGNDEGIQSWNGQMSIFRWYSRALSASEVADNFAGNRRRFGI